MAYFYILQALIVALWFSPSPSLSSTAAASKPKLHTPTISAAPSISPSDPPLSPYTAISPDIAPLLPSPGSTMPTIPSNPSPPNPDQAESVGPDPAFAPSGSQQNSSSAMCFGLGDFPLVRLLNIMAALWLWMFHSVAL